MVRKYNQLGQSVQPDYPQIDSFVFRNARLFLANARGAGDGFQKTRSRSSVGGHTHGVNEQV